jgi:hypothetical protein
MVAVIVPPGSSEQQTVHLRVATAIAGARLVVSGRPGDVVVRSSLPSLLEPGQEYPVQITINRPRSHHAHARAVLLLRDEQRFYAPLLQVTTRQPPRVN